MKKFTSDIFRSPITVFIIYIPAACLVIMIFRLIYPGEPPPLPYFSFNWRLLRGLLDILNLFPALILTGLVLPSGLILDSGELYGNFSPRHFNQFNGPITTAICALIIYALVFFLALPMAKSSEEDMRYKSNFYQLAKERAIIHQEAGEWLEALQFIEIAESVWPETPELEDLKTNATIQLDWLRFGHLNQNAEKQQPEIQQKPSRTALPGYKGPLEAADAIAIGEAAFAEERFYDAHWYATLGARLAKENSIEELNANRLAARAWNKISALEPDSREKERQALFRLKKSGYDAMISSDWIHAFYIFQELLERTPNDPDAANYYAISEKGIKEIAFFLDEMDLSLGHNRTSALFSLPAQEPHKAAGRAVLYFAGLSTASDYAYGTGLEYMVFDSQAQLTGHVRADYAKLLPITLDGRPRVIILMKALDRRDGKRHWDAQWNYDGDNNWQPGESQVFLDVSFEEFLILFHMRRGVPNLSIAELFSLQTIEDAGYISQTIDAEIIGRLGTVLFFLPLIVTALIIGWRFRAKTYPRYLFIPMLALLPLVFNGLTRLLQFILNNAGILLIFGVGFKWSLTILIASCALLLFFLFMLYAAQKE